MMKPTKVEELAPFIMHQTNVDIDKYIDENAYLSRNRKLGTRVLETSQYIILDWRKMSRDERRHVEDLSISYGGSYRLADVGEQQKAIVIIREEQKHNAISERESS